MTEAERERIRAMIPKIKALKKDRDDQNAEKDILKDENDNLKKNKQSGKK